MLIDEVLSRFGNYLDSFVILGIMMTIITAYFSSINVTDDAASLSIFVVGECLQDYAIG